MSFNKFDLVELTREIKYKNETLKKGKYVLVLDTYGDDDNDDTEINVDIGDVYRYYRFIIKKRDLKIVAFDKTKHDALRDAWKTDLVTRCMSNFPDIYTVGTNVDFSQNNPRYKSILSLYREKVDGELPEGETLRLKSAGMYTDFDAIGFVKVDAEGSLFGEASSFACIQPEYLRVIPDYKGENCKIPYEVLANFLDRIRINRIPDAVLPLREGLPLHPGAGLESKVMSIHENLKKLCNNYIQEFSINATEDLMKKVNIFVEKLREFEKYVVNTEHIIYKLNHFVGAGHKDILECSGASEEHIKNATAEAAAAASWWPSDRRYLTLLQQSHRAEQQGTGEQWWRALHIKGQLGILVNDITQLKKLDLNHRYIISISSKVIADLLVVLKIFLEEAEDGKRQSVRKDVITALYALLTKVDNATTDSVENKQLWIDSYSYSNYYNDKNIAWREQNKQTISDWVNKDEGAPLVEHPVDFEEATEQDPINLLSPPVPPAIDLVPDLINPDEWSLGDAESSSVPMMHRDGEDSPPLEAPTLPDVAAADPSVMSMFDDPYTPWMAQARQGAKSRKVRERWQESIENVIRRLRGEEGEPASEEQGVMTKDERKAALIQGVGFGGGARRLTRRKKKRKSHKRKMKKTRKRSIKNTHKRSMKLSKRVK